MLTTDYPLMRGGTGGSWHGDYYHQLQIYRVLHEHYSDYYHQLQIYIYRVLHEHSVSTITSADIQCMNN